MQEMDRLQFTFFNKKDIVYGTPEFLNTFYKNLGEHDLKPNEAGLKSLFETIKSELPKHLSRAENARKAWDDME